MPVRRFSSDVPSREPQMRRAVVRANLGDNLNFLIDVGDGFPQNAYWYQGEDIELGTQIMVTWSQEASQYLIRGPAGTPSA